MGAAAGGEESVRQYRRAGWERSSSIGHDRQSPKTAQRIYLLAKNKMKYISFIKACRNPGAPLADVSVTRERRLCAVARVQRHAGTFEKKLANKKNV